MGGIRIRSTSGSTIDSNNDYVSGSIFEHVKFNYADTALYVHNTGIYVSNSNFENNYNDWGLLSNVIHSDGKYYDLLKTNGGVSSNQKTGVIEMVGKEVFKHAVEKLSASLEEALMFSNKKINEIDWLVPHQANQRIILAVADRMNIDVSKVISTVKDHGNTSAASIPLALDKAISTKKILNGNLIGIHAIGGGLSWGASIIRIGQPTLL